LEHSTALFVSGWIISDYQVIPCDVSADKLSQSARVHSNLWRETSEEKREMQRLQDDMINDVRHCAEVHRQVRAYIRKIAQPGIKLIDMCQTLEDSVRNLIEARGLEAGIAFPTGCSLDWVAAHWTPNSGDKTVLTYDSVMKLGALQRIACMCYIVL
jgi:hypothetical protein